MKAAPHFMTERLQVRMASVEDVPAILTHFEQNREFFRPTDPPRPDAFYEAEFWRAQVLRSFMEFQQDESLRLFIFKSDARTVIGTVNFTQIVRGPLQACFLGYGISEREQGQGQMREALGAAIRYVFEELRLHRIMAGYMPHNARSARVLERLGFRIEGQAQDYLLINGEWRDHVLTSLVNPAWHALD